MSNREIIEWLKKKAEAVPMPGARKMYEAAAKALEAAQPEHGTNLASLGTDLISRQAAIDAVMECYDNDELFEVYEWKLNELPPIQPKRGRWVKLDMHIGMADHKCTACEQECYVPTCMGEPMYAFCPNCGADMREVTNGN